MFDLKQFLHSGAFIAFGRDQLLLGWGKRRRSSVPSPECFYFPDFFLRESAPWFTYEHQAVLPLSELKEIVGSEELTLKWNQPDYGLFKERFHHLKNEITLGNLQKGVPYVFATARGKGSVNLSHLLEFASTQTVFPYGFWDGEEGMIGATPERLFAMEKGVVRSVALAGTKRREESLADPKEQKEHRLVIEGIVEALKPFGSVTVGRTEETPFSTLKHLMTPIEVECDVGFETLVRALHPTPALGAYPREAGWQWLSDYQTLLPRGRFGAPVGFWYGGRGECFVAIRNVQWQGEQWRIGAGSGVVLESELEKEWCEVNMKIETVRRFLGV